jgi:hypothetical protein
MLVIIIKLLIYLEEKMVNNIYKKAVAALSLTLILSLGFFNTTFGAGGILPYIKGKKDGKIYFLLGRESSGWTDFVGQTDGNETTEETAAREGWEETSGTIPVLIIRAKIEEAKRLCHRIRDSFIINIEDLVYYKKTQKSRNL